VGDHSNLYEEELIQLSEPFPQRQIAQDATTPYIEVRCLFQLAVNLPPPSLQHMADNSDNPAMRLMMLMPFQRQTKERRPK
jgi:hypothetical protein